jgi:hypothetical protein
LISIASSANGERFGELNASNDPESFLIVQFPRNSLLLKQMQTWKEKSKMKE